MSLPIEGAVDQVDAARALSAYGRAPMPETVYIELADYCNLSCTFCERSAFVASTGKGGFIDFEMIRRLEQPLRAAKYLGLSGRIGEPLLHPRLKSILEWIYQINPRIGLKITTNGTALTQKMAEILAGHIEFIGVSLNASNAEAYVRDMQPIGFKPGDDPAQWWNNFIARITEFVGALSEEDRLRIRMIMPLHRGNLGDIFDFIRLVARMGCRRVAFSAMLVHEEDRLESSVYWVKDEYNEAIDRATALAAQVGIRVDAGRFYTHPRPQNLDLEVLCREPLEVAYLNMEKLGKTAPCCHWAEGAVPMDVYSDDGAFERFWNSETYQRLRLKRDFKSCKSCSMGRAFDELLFHFTPAWHFRLTEAGLITRAELQNSYPDEELVRSCRTQFLDLPSMRRTMIGLGLAPAKLRAIETQGLAVLPELDGACWGAFLSADPQESPPEIGLGGIFLGMGWGEADNDPANRLSARWMGGGRTASIYVKVRPGKEYEFRVTAHHVRSVGMASGLHLGANQSLLETAWELAADGSGVLSARIPAEATRDYDGRLRLAISYVNASGEEGWVSFSRAELVDNSAVA